MSIPDLAGLTPDELRVVAADAAARLHAAENTEANNRALLLDRPVVQSQIAALVQLAADMSALVDVPNADINAGPAPYIKDVARGVRRVARNTARLLRTEAGVLDDTGIGEGVGPT